MEGDSTKNKDQYVKYMGSFIERPRYPHEGATACSNSLLRVPPPAAISAFRVPPLRCSFPSLLHPHYELVKQHCDAWLLGFVQPASATARRLLLDCLLPRLVCRNIPTAPSLPRLIRAAKMVSWLIISDDEDDLPDALGADDTATSRSIELITAILNRQNSPVRPSALLREANVECLMLGERDEVPLEAASNEVPLEAASKTPNTKKGRALEALAQLWEEMSLDMPPNLQTRFIATMVDYLDAVKLQATYRKAHQLPNMESYIEIRRQASFILPCFCLVEYAIGIEIDADVYTNPLVQKFRSTVVDYMSLCNDILSCRVEIGVGDYFNMPSIVYNMCPNKEMGETFQDAIHFVAKMIEELDGQVLTLVACINESSLPSLQCSSIRAYITALGFCMSGSLAWYLESARYCNP